MYMTFDWNKIIIVIIISQFYLILPNAVSIKEKICLSVYLFTEISRSSSAHRGDGGTVKSVSVAGALKDQGPTRII